MSEPITVPAPNQAAPPQAFDAVPDSPPPVTDTTAAPEDDQDTDDDDTDDDDTDDDEGEGDTA